MEPENDPIRSTFGVNYLYTDSGKFENRLEAAKLEQFELEDSSYTVISGGFTFTFYDGSEEVDSRLTAINGLLLGTNFKMMIARDSVVFTNKENETLRTEELIYYKDSSKVYTDKFVTIEKKDVIIYGKGLVSNESFTDYQITEPTGVLYLDEGAEEENE